jgi:hypothetical protein
VALHQAGGLPTTDPAYRRDVAFLLQTQQEDGSWLVRSRSKPFQLYYESGFPHGKDRFISIAASAWATTALALTCPPAGQAVGIEAAFCRMRLVAPARQLSFRLPLGVLMKTALCHLLGIEHPIIAAPMGPDLTGPSAAN